MTSYKIAFTVFAKPTLITILLTLFNGAMRTAIKADFLSSKSFNVMRIIMFGGKDKEGEQDNLAMSL